MAMFSLHILERFPFLYVVAVVPSHHSWASWKRTQSKSPQLSSSGRVTTSHTSFHFLNTSRSHPTSDNGRPSKQTRTEKERMKSLHHGLPKRLTRHFSHRLACLQNCTLFKKNITQCTQETVHTKLSFHRTTTI